MEYFVALEASQTAQIELAIEFADETNVPISTQWFGQEQLLHNITVLKQQAKQDILLFSCVYRKN